MMIKNILFILLTGYIIAEASLKQPEKSCQNCATPDAAIKCLINENSTVYDAFIDFLKNHEGEFLVSTRFEAQAKQYFLVATAVGGKTVFNMAIKHQLQPLNNFIFRWNDDTNSYIKRKAIKADFRRFKHHDNQLPPVKKYIPPKPRQSPPAPTTVVVPAAQPPVIVEERTIPPAMVVGPPLLWYGYHRYHNHHHRRH